MKALISRYLRADFLFPKILIATIVFYLFKTALWPLTYLFIFSYIILIFYYLMNFNQNFELKGFIYDFRDSLLLAIIFIVVFFTGKLSINIVKKEILLISVLFSLFYFSYWYSKTYKKIIEETYITNFIIITVSIISFLSLINLLFPSIVPLKIHNALHIPIGSVANDYNFFCVVLFIGLISVNTREWSNFRNFKFSTAWSASLTLLFIINILLSGSRRAFFILIVLVLIKIIYWIIGSKNNYNISESLKKIYQSVIIIILTLSILLGVINFFPKQYLKTVTERYSNSVGWDNHRFVEGYLWKNESEIPTDRTVLIDKESFNRKGKYWQCVSAPGTVINFIETDYGEGIKVTRIDGERDGHSLQYVGPELIYYANHTYKISFKIKFISGDFDSFNVGWWVNDGNKGYANSAALKKDFQPLGNGWYNCNSVYTFIDNHYNITGFINSVSAGTSFIISDFKLIVLNSDSLLPRYVFEVDNKEDLESWLNTHNKPFLDNNLINNGDFKNGTAFWNNSRDSSLDLRIEETDYTKCALISREKGGGGDWSLYYSGRPVHFFAGNIYQISFNVKLLNTKAIPFKVGFWLDEGEGYLNNLKITIDTLKNGWLGVKASYLFKANQTDLIFPINSQESYSKFLITNIKLINITQSQFQLSTEFPLKKQREPVFSDRSSRWRFATELWKTEYSIQNKLIGHGFDYLEWYGDKFTGDSNNYDWPHNPFISILLYSGIIGLFFYIWLLSRVFYLYYKYRKEYSMAFLCFLITFFFSFFSASSPFDPPIMGFFILLPFFIHSIHKKDNSKNNAENSDNRQ